MSFIFPSNSKMYLDFTNGIIGIGTTNPTSNLHVVGNLTVTGDTNLSSISFGNGINGILNTASQPNITSVGTLTNLTVTGNITTSTGIITQGPITASGQSITAFSFQGKELSLEPQIMDSTALYISNGGASVDGDIIQTSGTTTLKTTTINGDLSTIGNSQFTGNVGIGNISNTANLTIYCNTSNTNVESQQHALLINSGNLSNGYTRTCMYMGADAAGNVGYVQVSRAGANLPLLLNNRGGNVGINTNSARSTLDVVGDIRLSGLLIGPTSAVTFTSSTIGYTATFSGSNSTQTNATISTVGLSGFTLPIGVWHLMGIIATSNNTGTTNISYTITGFSTSTSSFTSNYGCRSTIDNSTRSIGFGLFYTYGYFTHSQYVTMTASDTLYLLCQPYFSTNALYATGYVHATRIA